MRYCETALPYSPVREKSAARSHFRHFRRPCKIRPKRATE
jgi:hypothetical protein